MVIDTERYAKARLKVLRAELRAERISQAELLELHDFAEAGLIGAGDVELLEAAGVPESLSQGLTYDMALRVVEALRETHTALREYTDGNETDAQTRLLRRNERLFAELDVQV